MKIRSITYFLDLQSSLNLEDFQHAADFITEARPAFDVAGYEVQTVRIATHPFPSQIPSLDIDLLVEHANRLEEKAKKAGFDYISLGPALPEYPESYQLIPEVLSKTELVFLTGLMTTPNGGVSIPSVRACAQVIQQASTISPDGFANLRFAALANVPPGAPFFPAAYHGGETPTFALAMEAADLAVDAFSNATNLEEARKSLMDCIESHAKELSRISKSFAEKLPVEFGGIDFTMAPFPEEALSFGTAMERMGVPAVGQHGSLASAAILADTLDRASFQRAGFNGLMMPVLEDAKLAERAADGNLCVKDLLLYSAVCGTGLDTLPLPGDTSEDEINAVLLDIASLSQRLDKPLTARLMPIPGKQAGDPTDFDFAYFANSRTLGLQASTLKNFFAGEETFFLKRRPS
jgi:uncharacterized protein (UPF0210 family)